MNQRDVVDANENACLVPEMRPTPDWCCSYTTYRNWLCNGLIYGDTKPVLTQLHNKARVKRYVD